MLWEWFKRMVSGHTGGQRHLWVHPIFVGHLIFLSDDAFMFGSIMPFFCSDWIFIVASNNIRFPSENWFSSQESSGKQSHNYGKSPCLMGKLTISMAMFNSFLYVYQAGYPITKIIHDKPPTEDVNNLRALLPLLRPEMEEVLWGAPFGIWLGKETWEKISGKPKWCFCEEKSGGPRITNDSASEKIEV